MKNMKIYNLTSIIFLFLFCVSITNAQFKNSLRTENDPVSIGSIVKGIQERADSLNYISETDSDVNVFVVGRNVQILTPETFRSANWIDPSVSIEWFDYDTFWNRLLNGSDGAEWNQLKAFIENNLSDVQVFKVNTIRREIFAIGLYEGRIVGVRMFGLET